MRRRRVSWWDNEGWRSELPSEEAVVASACQYLLVNGVAPAVALLIAAEVVYRKPTFSDPDVELSGRLPVEVFGPPRLYDLLTADTVGDDLDKRKLIETGLKASLPHSLDGASLEIDLEPRMQIVEPYIGWREEFGQQASGRGITNQGAGKSPAPLRWMHNSFRTQGEIALAKAFERANVLFLPLPRAAIGVNPDLRTMVEPDFVICDRGKWGVLEVDGSSHEGRKAQDAEKDRLYHAHGIAVVRRYTEEQVRDHPDAVVAEFLRDVETLA